MTGKKGEIRSEIVDYGGASNTCDLYTGYSTDVPIDCARQPASSSEPMAISKSRVMAGLQCHKFLWWLVHESGAPELAFDTSVQAAFDRGRHVGQVARGYAPGGVLIDLPHNAYAERVSATRQLLDRGAAVIYEASFVADDVFVSVDILERVDAGFDFAEVKSSTGVKAHHITDVAVQTHVLRRSGLALGRREVMHLNRACTYPDLSNLFVRTEVTEAVEAVAPEIPKVIAQQLQMLAGALPDVPVGPHCMRPHVCPFMARCWSTVPEHHVSTLYAMSRRALELDEQGYETIHDLPEDFPLGNVANRQRRAVQEGRLIVEPTLVQALARFEPPIAFIDFETVGPPIPVWNGCRPYEAVPVEFSCHVEMAGGGVTHHEWLAEGPEDPRQELAGRLIRACEPARTMVAYGAGFERQCLERMAEALPSLATPLRRIASQLVDLLPVIRNHVYHPDFGGSFSLKQVLPALVPELRYDDLAINDGQMASLELERLLFRGPELAEDTKVQLRTDLLRYCHQDTWGLVMLLRRLRELAGA